MKIKFKAKMSDIARQEINGSFLAVTTQAAWAPDIRERGEIQNLRSRMTTRPAWVGGALPEAEGYAAKRYRKD